MKWGQNYDTKSLFHVPNDWPLGVWVGLECQYDDDDENGRQSKADEVPDKRRQPEPSCIHSTHKLRVLGIACSLIDDEYHERTYTICDNMLDVTECRSLSNN